MKTNNIDMTLVAAAISYNNDSTKAHRLNELFSAMSIEERAEAIEIINKQQGSDII